MSTPDAGQATMELAVRIAMREDPISVRDDLAARLRRVLADDDVAGGWDVGCVSLTVATAGAEACALGLDAATAARALSIAATQSGGLAGLDGTWLGDYQRDESVDRGREAAALAAAGLTAPTTGLEGRRGLVALIAPGVDPARLLDDEEDHRA